MITKMVESTLQIHNMFWANSSYNPIYAICFILVFFLFNKNKKALNSLGIYSLLILVLIAYNPIIAYVLLNYIIDDVGVPIRIFLLLPLYAVMSFVFTELVYRTKHKYKQIAVLCVLLVLIIMSGRSFYENGDFKIPTNIYKIDQEVIEVNDIIEKNYEDSGSISLVYQTDGTDMLSYWARRDDNLSEGLRQYNARLEFLHEFYDMQTYEQEGIDGIKNYLNVINDIDYQYVITEKRTDFNNDMQLIGFINVGETENFAVYRRMDY